MKIFDTLTAAHLLNENRQAKSLKALARDVLKIPEEQIKHYEDVDSNNLDEFGSYALNDAIWTYALYQKYAPNIEKEGLHDLFWKIEMPFVYALVELTINGMKADVPLAKEMLYETRHLYYTIEKEMLDMWGGEWVLKYHKRSGNITCEPSINFNSSDQVIPLVESLGFEIIEKTKKGKKSFGKKTKNRLAGKSPFIDLLIKYGKVEKLLSSFLEPFEDFVESDGKIRANFHNAVARTGRLCVHPDTFIECPRDLSLYPQGVPLHTLHVGDYVYSFDENKDLCLKQIKWIGPTKIKPTVKISTDKGPTLIVSREHLVRKFKGEWVYAKDLKIGDRLLCMPKRGLHDKWAVFFPYSKNRKRFKSVLDGGSHGGRKASGGRYYEHRFIYEQVMNTKLGSKAIIHHIDQNPLNNSIDNLERITNTSGHSKLHWKLRQNHRITKIEYGEPEQLWDLEVEDTHCFIGNDIALHNSSSNPNVEQLPNENDIANVRNLYIADDGCVFVVADYKGQELRVLAEESQDPTLKRAFAEDIDLHQMVADETGVSRKDAKAINFGVIYGKSAYGFAQDFGVSNEEAQEFIDKYFKQFPRVYTRIEQCNRKVITDGYVRNLAGRKRRFPGFLRMNKWQKERCLRQAFNFIIQGFSADMVKIAASKVIQCPLLKLVNIVHDEIVVMCKEEYIEDVVNHVRQSMVNAVSMSIPLEVEISVGQRYGEAK